jgi:hypothetical protein
MGAIKKPLRAKLFCGLIGVSGEVLLRAEQELKKLFGPIDVRSDTLPFDFTDYYREEMGEGLRRRFVSFVDLVDPAAIVSVKLLTNSLEAALGVVDHGRLRRKVNLDPGYVTAAKLVLATTKDFAHRVYLGDGIYAEVTLAFTKDGHRFFDWTYPDFKSGLYNTFFADVRRRLLAEEAALAAAAP